MLTKKTVTKFREYIHKYRRYYVPIARVTIDPIIRLFRRIKAHTVCIEYLFEALFNAQVRITVTNNADWSIDKTVYVIRVSTDICGVANIEYRVLAYCMYAERKGYVPVVDLQNYQTIYHETGEVGKKNVWEAYYEQPGGITLNAVNEARTVIYSPYSYKWKSFLLHKLNGTSARKRHRLFRKYIRLNDCSLKYVESERKRIISDADKILGVVARGTDYKMLSPKGHARQPAVDKVIDKCKEVMQEHGCNKLFLATEDQSIFDEFMSAFGSQLIYPKALRFYGEEGKFVGQYQASRENDRYLRGLEYLTALEILAECDCFVGTGCAATAFRGYRRSEREYEYVFNEGVY